MEHDEPDLGITVPITELVDFSNPELEKAVPFNLLIRVEIIKNENTPD